LDDLEDKVYYYISKLDGRNEENPRGQGIRATGRGEGPGWQQNLSRGGGGSSYTFFKI
jgi:hypothetical protein